MNQPDLAEDRNAIGTVARWAVRGEFHGTVADLRQHFFLRKRLRIDIALHQIRAALLHQVKLVHRLDPFGDGFHAQRLGQRDDGGDDRRVGITIFGAATHEALVDLELVEMPVLEIAER